MEISLEILKDFPVKFDVFNKQDYKISIFREKKRFQSIAKRFVRRYKTIFQTMNIIILKSKIKLRTEFNK